MERLIGKNVNIFLLTYDHRGGNPIELDLKGTVGDVRGNLIFLINVSKYWSGEMRMPNQVINTLSSSFIRIEINN